jgi:hypothetical protein
VRAKRSAKFSTLKQANEIFFVTIFDLIGLSGKGRTKPSPTTTEKTMLSCREVCENAHGYVDADISVWKRLQIRLHLAMCRNCTNFIDQTRKTKVLIAKSLGRDEKAEVSPDLMAAFTQSTKKNPAEDPTPSGGSGRRKLDDT